MSQPRRISTQLVREKESTPAPRIKPPPPQLTVDYDEFLNSPQMRELATGHDVQGEDEFTDYTQESDEDTQDSCIENSIEENRDLIARAMGMSPGAMGPGAYAKFARNLFEPGKQPRKSLQQERTSFKGSLKELNTEAPTAPPKSPEAQVHQQSALHEAWAKCMEVERDRIKRLEELHQIVAATSLQSLVEVTYPSAPNVLMSPPMPPPTIAPPTKPPTLNATSMKTHTVDNFLPPNLLDLCGVATPDPLVIEQVHNEERLLWALSILKAKDKIMEKLYTAHTTLRKEYTQDKLAVIMKVKRTTLASEYNKQCKGVYTRRKPTEVKPLKKGRQPLTNMAASCSGRPDSTSCPAEE